MRARSVLLIVAVLATVAPAAANAAPAAKKPVKVPAFHATLGPVKETFSAFTAVDTFSLRGTQAPAGDSITGWTLSFGDGSKPAKGRSVPPTVRHSYRKSGSYHAVLTITDAHHRHASTTRTVNATGRYSAPTIGVITDASSLPAVVGDKIDFTVASRVWKPLHTTQISFSAGDGSAATVIYGNTNHTYSTPGTYTVTATVTDSDGGTATASTSVVVGAAPTVTAQAPAVVNAGEPFVLMLMPQAANGVSVASIVSVSAGSGATIVPTGAPNSYAVTLPVTSFARSTPVSVLFNDSHGAHHYVTATTLTVNPAPSINVFVEFSGSYVDYSSGSSLGDHTATDWSLDDSVDGHLDDDTGMYPGDTILRSDLTPGAHVVTLTQRFDKGALTITSTYAYTV